MLTKPIGIVGRSGEEKIVAMAKVRDNRLQVRD
jgi:hypothetical protein